MTPDPARGELAPQPDRPRSSQTAVPGVAGRLAGLADWIDQRLNDEDYDRQVIAETAVAHLRDLAAALAGAAEHAAQRPVTAAQPGRAAAGAMLRATAEVIETRADIPQPSAAVHFILTARSCADVAAAVTAVAAAIPGQWEAVLSRNANGDWLDLTTSAGTSALDRTEVTVSAAADAVCAATGTTTVTTWEPLPAITQFLGGRPVEGAGGEPR